MKTYKLMLLIAVSAGALGTAHAQTASNEHGIPDAPTRQTVESTSSTGSIIKKDLRWKSKIPLNKTYDQLTPEEKAELNSMYEKLADGDEPPFPAKGMKPIFNAIKKGQSVLRARGELNFGVTVGPDGVASKVDDFGGVGGPNAYEMSQYVASILVKAQYKPAVCQGKPCSMQFPFRLKLN
ncbi:MAG: hypothetical protein ABI821_17605 [Pseudomonadota bacterium]